MKLSSKFQSFLSYHRYVTHGKRMCSSNSTISIEKILNKYKHESLSIDDTAAQLEKHFKQSKTTGTQSNDAVLSIGNYAKIDLTRQSRAGFPEVIFGSGKDAGHLAEIMRSMHAKQIAKLTVKATKDVDKDNKEKVEVVIATRVSPDQFAHIKGLMGDEVVRYRPHSRIAHTIVSEPPRVGGTVAVLCAGTSDFAVAEEAAVLLELSGVAQVLRVYDVGVAGLHRLLSNLDTINTADVVIVCAGMDGALPSVVGGLVRAPVIAVPTSIGYGVAFQGISAMLTMLNSCAPGVSVVNIDNGFGAAVSAYKILKLKEHT